MRKFLARSLGLRTTLPSPPPENGDTLIEILVTITIISIGIVAILGSLLTSTSASVTNRGQANLNSFLRSFAESARYQIQTQPQDGTTGPLFRPCAASYALVSDPVPNTAPVGTPVVLFATGFNPAAGTVLKTTFTPPTGPAVTISQNVPATNGNGTINFTVPSGVLTPGTPYEVNVVDSSGNSASPRVPFTVPTTTTSVGGTAGTLAAYSITSSVGPYNGDCNHMQQVTLRLTNSQQGNASTDSVQFIVGNFAPQPVVVSVTSTSSNVPATVKFTASVTDGAGIQVTAGSVTWMFTSHPASFTPSCPAFTLTSTSGPATCTIRPSYGQDSGSPPVPYTVKATYTGGAYPNGLSGQTSITLGPATPAVNILWGTCPLTPVNPLCGATNPQPPDPAAPLMFTAQVVGCSGGTCPAPIWPGAGTPTPAYSWTILSSDGSLVTESTDCTTGTPSGAGTWVATYTCTITNPGSVTKALGYTVTFSYSGNTTYSSASNTQGFTVPLVNVTGATGTGHGKVNFTITVSGLPGDNPTGSLTCAITDVNTAVTTTTTCGNGPNTMYNFTGTSGDLYTATVTYNDIASSNITNAVSQPSTPVAAS